jgi:hypothetical protein
MAQRFFEVEVSRAIYTSVTIVVDDQDEKYQKLFADKFAIGGFSILKQAAKEAASKVAQEYDWETDKEDLDINGYKEVSKEEALQYKVWDSQNNRILNE